VGWSRPAAVTGEVAEKRTALDAVIAVLIRWEGAGRTLRWVTVVDVSAAAGGAGWPTPGRSTASLSIVGVAEPRAGGELAGAEPRRAAVGGARLSPGGRRPRCG